MVAAAAVAAVAAVAGIELALRNSPQPRSSLPDASAQALWAMQWPTPQGAMLQMQSFKGCPLLLNFWAPWCPPCVEELPLLNTFYRQNRSAGWQVLGLALDTLAPVKAFLAKMPLSFPVGLAGAAGMELARSLGDLTGGLPFSVVIGAQGGALHRKMGQVSQADLDAWIRLE